MSATGLQVFDKTVQTTNIWLDEIMAVMGPDRQHAWHVLGAVLRALRDRLPLGGAIHLGAQLPLLVRGAYYDSWHAPEGVDKERTEAEFLAHVSRGLAGTRPTNADQAVRTVLRVLDAHVTKPQMDKVKGALPEPIRAFWPAVPNAA